MLHLRTRKQRITALAFSPNGRFLAVGGTSTRVDVWDFGKAKSKPVILPFSGGWTASVLFTPAGLLVTVNDRGLQLYDPATTTLHPPVTVGLGFFPGAVLSADGTGLFTCGLGPTRRFDVSPEFPVRWSVSDGPREVGRFTLSGCFLDAKGRLVVPLVSNPTSVAVPVQPRSWLRTHNPETGKAVGVRAFDERLVGWVRVSADRTTGAFLDARRLRVGPLAGTTFPTVAEVPDPPRQNPVVAFHPSGKWLVCGTATGVRVYETATWREAKVLEWGAGPLEVLAFDADGSRAAGGGTSGTVVVWDWDL